MTAINECTGDKIQTKGGSNDAYRSGWDAIFAKKVITESEADFLVEKAFTGEKALLSNPASPFCPHCGAYELTEPNPHGLYCPKRTPFYGQPIH